VNAESPEVAAADFQPDPIAEAFYAGAEHRALRFLIALAVIGAIVAWVVYGH